MQNKPEKSDALKPMPQGETERELYSEKKAAFIEAVDCLYIHNNHSARHAFGERWPAAAEYIFDPKLLEFDRNGVQNDEERQQRRQLEDAADNKRMELLSVFQGMEQKLVIYGSLQVEALDEIMKQISKEIAEYVFSERFVTKYFPDPNTGVQNAFLSPDINDSNRQVVSLSATEPENANASTITPSSSTAASQMPRSLDYPEIATPPEVISDSIGHVDHSYQASLPEYDSKNGKGEPEEDLSWLNQVEEDEFEGVSPISVSEPVSSTPATLTNTGQAALDSQEQDIKMADPNVTEPPVATDSPSVPPVPSGEESQPQLRVPSLDDLDNHVKDIEKPKASEMLPSDVTPRGGSDLPPIPGSEDSGESEDIDSFFSKK